MTDKKKKQGSFIKNIMAGIGAGVPIFATLALFNAIISKIDGAVIGNMIDGVIVGGLPGQANPGYWAPVLFDYPGIGVIALVVALYFGGAFVRTWLGSKLVSFGHYIMAQIPLVGTAFKMIKKIIDQVTASGDDAPEKKPVMVEHLRDDVYAPAFSLGYSTMFISPRTGLALQVIYFPSAPNPTSGWIILVPDMLVHEVEFGGDAQMEFILSCGFSQVQVDSVAQALSAGAQAANILPTGDIVTVDGVVEVVKEQPESKFEPTVQTKEEVNAEYSEKLASMKDTEQK